MKKLFALFVGLVAFSPLFASNPTLTISRISSNAVRYTAYEFSFTTSADTNVVDTVFVYPATSTPFDIGGGQGTGFMAKRVSLELFTTETTADSVRFRIDWQTTSAVSPEYESGDMKSWSTVATAVDTNSVLMSLQTFEVRGYAGQMPKMRVLIYENGGVKCSRQTITGRLLIPKP